jgi:membrane-associated protease RseP (regulator of RpoE activity)
MDGWLVALLVLLAYGALVIILGQTGLLARAGVQAYGPILVWRTGRGRTLLERLAKARRLWAAFARMSVVLVFLVMALMVVTLLIQTLYIARIPADSIDPQYAIGIPGVNPIIPLGFGIVGLAVAILVHEGCHGILARAEGIKVRSVGLLVVLFPIGAFVEPDEQEMRAAPLGRRQRIYGVGPSSNIVLALACAGVFSAGFMGALAPVDDGVVVTAVFAGSAADNASIKPFTLIDEIQFGLEPARDLRGPGDFENFMLARHPGENVTLYTVFEGRRAVTEVTLGARARPVPGRSNAVLGVIAEAPENFTLLARPGAASAEFCGGAGRGLGSGCYAQTVAFYLGMPLRGESPAPAARQALYAPSGALAGLGGSFWAAADLFYWLFWLNFMVGTFNALPMLPLDGGHMFKDGVLGVLRRRAAASGSGAGGEAAVRKARVEALEVDIAMMEDNAKRAEAVRDELRAAAASPGAAADARRELEVAEREALETRSEVARLGEQLAIVRGEDATLAGPANAAPADDLFGPRRFRDALDRRAHTIATYTSLAMLVLIMLPFIVPRLLGTGGP